MRTLARHTRVPATIVTLLAAGLAAAAAQSVTTYHNSPTRHGDYVVPGLTLAAAPTLQPDTAFNASFTGNVYAQPLFWKSKAVPKGEIIVATESDTVVALDPASGAQLWQTSLGTAVPHSDLPCGNIDPEGVTGTPAIDPASGTIYLDALVTTPSGPRQKIFAVDADTGAVLSNWPIDVQSALAAQNITFDSTTEGERGGVLFDAGAVYVTYGARSGDCGTYHGIALQVNPASVTIAGFWQTGADGGGIWAQGGPFAMGSHILVTTGNTFNTSTWAGGEAILEFSPGLAAPEKSNAYFAPMNWQSLDQSDSDLGGTNATGFSVPDGTISVPRLLALGKDGNAYLVNGANLGGISHPIETVKVSNGSIITATATYERASDTLVAFRNSADLKCGGAITMLRVTPVKVNRLWCAGLNGAGAPILTTIDGTHDPIIWVTGAEGDNLLHGFNANTGAVLYTSSSGMTGLRHFGTLIAAAGRLYVGADGTVYAFALP